MKTILLLLFTLLLLLFPASAGTANFKWLANPESYVAGYRLYERISATERRLVAETNAATLKAAGEFTTGPHTVYFVAFAADGTVSPESDPLTFIMPAPGSVLSKPGGLVIEAIIQISIPPQQP